MVFNVEPAAAIDDMETRVDRRNLPQCLVGYPYNYQDFNVATRHFALSPSTHFHKRHRALCPQE
jgi:hypothetical protein